MASGRYIGHNQIISAVIDLNKLVNLQGAIAGVLSVFFGDVLVRIIQHQSSTNLEINPYDSYSSHDLEYTTTMMQVILHTNRIY